MAVVGLLEYNWENPRREKQYILPMFVPGSAEFFNMNKQQIADHPEVTAFFERMTFLPLEHITAMVPPGGAGIGMHVIPVEKAIETENRSADIEHISHWLKKYDGKYAARSVQLPYVPRPPWARAAAMTPTTGASEWATWPTTSSRPTRGIT